MNRRELFAASLLTAVALCALALAEPTTVMGSHVF